MRRVLFALALAAVAFLPLPAGASDIERHGTITCADTATQIVPAHPGRRSLYLFLVGATTVFLGQHVSATDRPLTAANGRQLAQNGTFAFENGEMRGAFHCITSSGSSDLRWTETYQ